MVKKENAGIDPGKIITSTLLGLISYILFIIVFTIMIKHELLPFNIMKLISKLSLFAACLIGCKNVKSKSRGELFTNCILTSILIFGLVILMSTMSENWKFDIAGIIICLFISIIACFMLLIKKKKNSKLHKNRAKR